MNKKIKAALLAMASILMLAPATALAANGFDPTGQSSTTTNGTDGKQIIPIYGYIGKDTTIVDPDPEDPTKPIETEIYVEVPVKILFASFESDKGAITSPQYTITNLSTANDVKVEVKDFAQRNESAADLGGKLNLELTDYSGNTLLANAFPADYSTPRLLKATLPKKTGGNTDNVLPFAIGGSWAGTFSEDKYPVFDMTLQFTVQAPDES